MGLNGRPSSMNTISSVRMIDDRRYAGEILENDPRRLERQFPIARILGPGHARGTALAGALDGPLLLTETDALPSQVAGEIERRESLSKLKLETALKALQDYRLVQLNEDILERGDGVESVADLHALEPKLTGFLR